METCRYLDNSSCICPFIVGLKTHGSEIYWFFWQKWRRWCSTFNWTNSSTLKKNWKLLFLGGWEGDLNLLKNLNVKLDHTKIIKFIIHSTFDVSLNKEAPQNRWTLKSCVIGPCLSVPLVSYITCLFWLHTQTLADCSFTKALNVHQLEFWFLALLISVFLPVCLYAEHNQVLVASELGFLWFSVVNTHINGGQTQVKSWDVFAAILCIVCLSIFKLQSLGLLEAQMCRFFRVLLFQSLLVSIGLLPESFIHVTNSDPPVDNSAQWWCVRVWGNETWYSLFSTSIQRAWGRSFENAHVEGWLLL